MGIEQEDDLPVALSVIYPEAFGPGPGPSNRQEFANGNPYGAPVNESRRLPADRAALNLRNNFGWWVWGNCPFGGAAVVRLDVRQPLRLRGGDTD